MNRVWIRIVFSPDRDRFETIVRNTIEDTYAGEVVILYCGHGSEEGFLYLFDGLYDPSTLLSRDLKSKNVPYPSITIRFNSCYADRTVKKIQPDKFEHEQIQTLWDKIIENGHALVDFLHKDPQTTIKFKIQNNVEISLIPYSFGRLKSEGRIDLFESNRGTWKQYLIKWRLLVWDKTSLSGTSSSRGFDQSIIETAWTYNDNLDINNENIDQEDIDNFTVFQSNGQRGGGDSILIRTGGINILVDGCSFPRGSNIPVFWDVLSKLSHLDLVVATHGDADHTSGIFRLACWLQIEENRNKFKVDKFIMSSVYKDEEETERYALSCHEEIPYLFKNAGINHEGDCVQYCVDSLTKEGQEVKVIFIWPDKECHNLLTKQITDMKNKKRESKSYANLLKITEEKLSHTNDVNRGERLWYTTLSALLAKKLGEVGENTRSLSDINKYCLSFIIKILKNEKECNLLFTGDAPGDKILEAIKGLKGNKKCRHFRYIDIPHHGSDLNNNEMLIEGIAYLQLTVDYFVVSTNGTGFHTPHPHENTLKALSTYCMDEGHEHTQIVFSCSDDTFKSKIKEKFNNSTMMKKSIFLLEGKSIPLFQD